MSYHLGWLSNLADQVRAWIVVGNRRRMYRGGRYIDPTLNAPPSQTTLGGATRLVKSDRATVRYAEPTFGPRGSKSRYGST